jgi:hypothetical protein
MTMNQKVHGFVEEIPTRAWMYTATAAGAGIICEEARVGDVARRRRRQV